MEVEPKKREADMEGDDLVDVPSKKPKTEDSSVVKASFKIDVDAAEDKGSRHTMEDAWVVLLDATLDYPGKLRLLIWIAEQTEFREILGSSDEFIDANIQLALAVVKKLQEKQETRACLVFPDKPEKRRASELFKSALDSIDGITIGSLDMSMLDL
ncbi:hypothetical protein HN51_004442 [Arachis hypogaea]